MDGRGTGGLVHAVDRRSITGSDDALAAPRAPDVETTPNPRSVPRIAL